ncbi:hypothetical protein GUJ93_ZPchr0006g44048 [Zizania palustris]|uniref:Uncharacterized protein n=1 Tax=Zizania palustris TaxID=103762 RepID=A0A8J5VM20_ZIZPA|nr:hypothetical protein GUJ93_ZPchr0006g44048 [Zizania palustris]
MQISSSKQLHTAKGLDSGRTTTATARWLRDGDCGDERSMRERIRWDGSYTVAGLRQNDGQGDGRHVRELEIRRDDVRGGGTAITVVGRRSRWRDGGRTVAGRWPQEGEQQPRKVRSPKEMRVDQEAAKACMHQL